MGVSFSKISSTLRLSLVLRITYAQFTLFFTDRNEKIYCSTKRLYIYIKVKYLPSEVRSGNKADTEIIIPQGKNGIVFVDWSRDNSQSLNVDFKFLTNGIYWLFLPWSFRIDSPAPGVLQSNRIMLYIIDLTLDMLRSKRCHEGWLS